jgi:hypothetical protein
MWRSGEEYRSILETPPRSSGELEWIPLGPTRWPVRAERIQARVRIPRRWLPLSEGSALPSFEWQAREPEAIAAYVALVERLHRAFVEGDTRACKALHAEATSALPSSLLVLFEAQMRRERLWLIETLLRRHELPPVLSLPRPMDRRTLFSPPEPEYAPRLLPRQRPPELLLLKLARLHDRTTVRFMGNGETDSRDFISWMDESALQLLCAELPRKTPSWRQPCQHLVDTRP